MDGSRLDLQADFLLHNKAILGRENSDIADFSRRLR